MQCPYCQTDNRDDQEKCYHCGRDVAMLRLIVNKAKHHYNQGLELADRNRNDEAITEMKNALDLDASMVNARVVLGTLYAKQERFDEARRAWGEALGTDHRFQKAHEYLAKADAVEQALPVLKQQRQTMVRLAYALGGMILLSAILLIIAIVAGLDSEDPPQSPPDRGVEVPRQEPPSQAPPPSRDNRESELEKQLRADLDTAREQTRVAQRQAEALENERLDLAVAALSSGADALALELANQIRQRDGAQGAQAARAGDIAQQALDKLSREVVVAGEAYLAGDGEYEAFARQADDFLRLAGDAPQGEPVRQLRQRIDQASGERLLAEANARIARDPLPDAVAAAVALKTRRPDLAEAVGMTLDLRLDAEATSLTASVEAASEGGNFGEARRRVDQLAMLWQSAGRTVPADRLADLRKAVDQRIAASQWDGAEHAYASGDDRRFFEIYEDLQLESLPEAVQADARATALKSRRRLAQADWEWFHKLDPQFGDGRISVADAKRATEVYRSTIENLPAALAYAKAPILYYTAMAQVKLGQPDRARELAAELDAIPNKGYVKAAFEKLKASLAPPAQ